MPERPKGRNSYVTPPTRVDGSAPNPSNQPLWNGPGRYTVPSVFTTNDPEYTDGFSPTLKPGGSSDGSALPDDIRIGARKVPATGDSHTYNDPAWKKREINDQRTRNLADHYETMWQVRQNKPHTPRLPIWDQERLPVRPTAQNSPTGYGMSRYWHIPRNAADVDPTLPLHFSLADHRRKYPIMGMKPQGRTGVNTYRAEPRPWDENLLVTPPAGTVPFGIAGNRSWRA